MAASNFIYFEAATPWKKESTLESGSGAISIKCEDNHKSCLSRLFCGLWEGDSTAEGALAKIKYGIVRKFT